MAATNAILEVLLDLFCNVYKGIVFDSLFFYQYNWTT